jgi:hypothetical protein
MNYGIYPILFGYFMARFASTLFSPCLEEASTASLKAD